jgi:hypothetical protein
MLSACSDPYAVLLTDNTHAERDESSHRVSDIEERLHEYEQALDELERDHEAKLSSAALDARRSYEAEHAITLAEFGKCRDNERLMRQALDSAERTKREEVCLCLGSCLASDATVATVTHACLQVNAVATEWEQVYKELEALYFAARDDAERKTEALARAHRDLEFWKSEASLATKHSIEGSDNR